jgi:hypothetical protein
MIPAPSPKSTNRARLPPMQCEQITLRSVTGDLCCTSRAEECRRPAKSAAKPEDWQHFLEMATT